MFIYGLLAVTSILGLYGIYKFYQDMNGQDDLEKKKQEIHLLIKRAKNEANGIIAEANKNSEQIISDAQSKATIAKNEKEANEKEVKRLKREIKQLSGQSVVLSTNVSDGSILDGITSEECKDKLMLIRQKEKSVVSDGNATTLTSASSGSNKYVTNKIKQILRCFNSECDNYLINISAKNVDAIKGKIQKSFESLNKIYVMDGVKISDDYLSMKLEEATLIFGYEDKKRLEREQQQAIKEQMVEEEKVRREIEREKQKLEKDEKQFQNEINKLTMYLDKSDDDVKTQLYAEKIRELQSKVDALEEQKKNVLEREQNAKAGFVYVISNIGSFGEDIYKIGMTRRLQPMDRVKELSSASVPFEFDVHAMIFSEDAPKLESELHSKFNDYRLNKVNPRKEFFKVSLKEIEEEVKKHNATVEFTMNALAKEYRDSVALEHPTTAISETEDDDDEVLAVEEEK